MGETLEIIAKPEPVWWQARNALDSTGLVPVVCVRPCSYRRDLRPSTKRAQPVVVRQFRGRGAIHWFLRTAIPLKSNRSGDFLLNVECDMLLTRKQVDRHLFQPTLPAVARVLFDRRLNACGRTELKLENVITNSQCLHFVLPLKLMISYHRMKNCKAFKYCSLQESDPAKLEGLMSC
uniref:SH3 domain-containing protein n=1 Tax=Angiostrongylus cantonensis TaxID=6313 RepID=A0A0K0DMI4_ANGCA